MKTRFGANDSLITNESGFAHQADLGKSHLDSVPKGHIMANAKTLRRRIALVAAAAVGVGMIVAAPAFAVNGSTLPTLSPAATATVVMGTPATTTTVMGFTAAAASDTSALTAAYTATGGGTATITFGTATALVNGSFTSPTETATAAGLVSASVPVTVTPSSPGIYVVTLTNTAAVGTATQTFTVTATLPASFTVTVPTTGVTGNGTATIAVSQQAGANNYVELTAPATALPVFTAGVSQALVSVTGGTISYETPTAGLTSVNTVTPPVSLWTLDGTGTIATLASGTLPATVLRIATPTAGTITVKYISRTWLAGIATDIVSQTITITVTPGPSGIFGASVPAAAITAAGVGFLACGVLYAPASPPNVLAANISATLFDTNGFPLDGATITAAVTSGPGILSIGGVLRARIVSAVVAGNVVSVQVYTDGYAGKSTITLSVGTTVIGTFSVVFYGPVATLAATSTTVFFPVASPAGTITVTALDSAGNAVPNTVPTVTVADPTVATVTGGAFSSTTCNYSYVVNGLKVGSTVATFTVGAVTTTYTINVHAANFGGPFNFFIGDSKGILTSTFGPNAPATLNITATNADGSAIADGSYSVFTTNPLTSISLGTGLGSIPFPNGVATFVGGVVTPFAFYTPLQAGVFSFNGTGGSALPVALQGKIFTASATVTGDTANAAAIAAAKASADAATAAVAALSTTIASLIASITAQIRALAAQIAKLMGRSGGSTPGLPKTGIKRR